MSPDVENVLRSTAKKVLTERLSPGNTLTYRQLLDKHVEPIQHLITKRTAPYLTLSCFCIRVENET